MREHGTMDFDYRRRCALLVAATTEMPEHQVVYYGLMSRELGRWDAADLPGYQSDGRGRRPGMPYTERRHFFNKRIMTDDERIGLAAIQADRDEARVRALYGVGGATRAEETAAPEGGAGSGGAYSYAEEDCPGHVASGDPRVCRNCGVHIDSLRPDHEEGDLA